MFWPGSALCPDTTAAPSDPLPRPAAHPAPRLPRPRPAGGVGGPRLPFLPALARPRPVTLPQLHHQVRG